MKDTPFSKEILRKIVFRASSLHERLKLPVKPVPPPEDSLVHKRLHEWCKITCKLDWQKFEKRLTWEGHTLDSIRPYLGPAYEPAPGPTGPEGEFPAWANLLEELLGWVGKRQDRATWPAPPFLNPQNLLPFEEILAPFVELAEYKLSQQAGTKIGLLSPEALIELERYLLEMLAYRAEKALHLEFQIFKKRQRLDPSSDLERLFAPVEGRAADTGINPVPKSNAAYLRFCRLMLDKNLAGFFLEYSRLAHRLAGAVLFWLESTLELLERLANDIDKMAALFNEGREPGQVLAVKADISDRHNRGRTVNILTFQSGLRLVYKPKELELEEAFFNLLDWCNRKQEPGVPSFRNLKVLVRPGYGWVEFAEHRPCRDLAEIGRFFQRIGGLLALFYAIKGSDYHNENLIASGEFPIPIDMETLFTPDMAPHKGPGETTHAGSEDNSNLIAWSYLNIGQTVLNSGLLPALERGWQGQVYDSSGLGGYDLPEKPPAFDSWLDLNTDEMRPGSEPLKPEKPLNLPEYQGKPVNPHPYREEVEGGFQAVYRFLRAHRQELMSDSGPLILFKDRRTRYLMRNTRAYFQLLLKSNRPEYLREGLDCSLMWDGLARPFLELEEKSPGWPVVEAEHRALHDGDVPLFHISTTSTSIELGPGWEIKNAFGRSGYAGVMAQLQNLAEPDLARQVELIRYAFYAPHVRPPSGLAGSYFYQKPPDDTASSIKPVETGVTPWPEMLSQVEAVAGKLQEMTFYNASHHPVWFGVNFNPPLQRYQVSQLGFNMYTGREGIALFLAAFEKYSPGQGFGEMGRKAINSWRNYFLALTPGQLASLPINIGGMNGLGSVAYTWLNIGLFTGDEALMADACKVAGLISPEVIARDNELDVINGSAGAILTLLALHRRTGEARFLEQARACGKHLLDKRVASPEGFRVWPGSDGRLLTGFSHGAAGIAYALVQLYRQTGQVEFRAAALESTGYERRLLERQGTTWPDSGDFDPGAAFYNQWCYGATGIGYSRLGMLEVEENQSWQEDLETAVNLTLGQDLLEVDHLCCGNAGQISFLSEAARRRDRPDWQAGAAARLEKLLEQFRQPEGYRLFAKMPSQLFHPGFMQGITGVAYEWLRLARPALQLPNCLLLD